MSRVARTQALVMLRQISDQIAYISQKIRRYQDISAYRPLTQAEIMDIQRLQKLLAELKIKKSRLETQIYGGGL